MKKSILVYLFLFIAFISFRSEAFQFNLIFQGAPQPFYYYGNVNYFANAYYTWGNVTYVPQYYPAPNYCGIYYQYDPYRNIVYPVNNCVNAYYVSFVPRYNYNYYPPTYYHQPRYYGYPQYNPGYRPGRRYGRPPF